MLDFESVWKNRSGDVEQIARSVGFGFGAASRFKDLVAVGQVALWKICQRYDAERGVPLWSYAYPRIKGAMIDEVRKSDHVGRYARQLIRERGAEAVKPWALLHACDISSATNVPANDNPEENVGRQEINSQLSQLMSVLTDVERHVVQKTIYENVTLLEVGNELGLTEGRICQIRKNAIERIASHMSYCDKCQQECIDTQNCPVCGDQVRFAAEVVEVDDEDSPLREPDISHGKRKVHHLLTFEGKTQGVKAWAVELGLLPVTIYSRLRQGLPIEKVLAPPRGSLQSAGVPSREPSPSPPPRRPAPAAPCENLPDDVVVQRMRDRLARLGEIEVEISLLVAEKQQLLASFL
jgi:RNA polymerase sigma factor (sigma-70 family)